MSEQTILLLDASLNCLLPRCRLNATSRRPATRGESFTRFSNDGLNVNAGPTCCEHTSVVERGQSAVAHLDSVNWSTLPAIRVHACGYFFNTAHRRLAEPYCSGIDARCGICGSTPYTHQSFGLGGGSAGGNGHRQNGKRGRVWHRIVAGAM